MFISCSTLMSENSPAPPACRRANLGPGSLARLRRGVFGPLAVSKGLKHPRFVEAETTREK